MLRIWSVVALGSSAALALAASADSTRAPAAAQQGYFDPVLSGALCVSSASLRLSGEGKFLMAYALLGGRCFTAETLRR